MSKGSKGAKKYSQLDLMCMIPVSQIMAEARNIAKAPLEDQIEGAYSSLYLVIGEKATDDFMTDYVGNMRNLEDWLPDPASVEYWRQYHRICFLKAYATAALLTVGDIEK